MGSDCPRSWSLEGRTACNSERRTSLPHCLLPGQLCFQKGILHRAKDEMKRMRRKLESWELSSLILCLPNRYKVPGLMPKVAREGIKERGGEGERKERKRKGRRREVWGDRGERGELPGIKHAASAHTWHLKQEMASSRSHVTMRTEGEAFLHTRHGGVTVLSDHPPIVQRLLIGEGARTIHF